MEHLTLFFRQGSSDKIYQAGIVPKDGGYVVQFQYGRRGSALQSGQKNPVRVPYEQAKRIYDQLIASKVAKGYQPGEDGVPYQHTGRRQLIRKHGDSITGINRLGLAVALPQPLVDDAAACPEDFILDGEAIGDTLNAFDVLLVGDDEIGGLRYTERYLRLMNLLAAFQHRHIQLVETHFTTAQKRDVFDRFKKRKAEGVVFKHTDAPYIAGRPASGGTQLKHKFYETASFIVGKVNAKRSVSLLLLEGDKIKAAGNVTIPPSHNVPTAGEVVECRYLYAFAESGSIYQPVFLGRREDIQAEECTTAQLKYRAEPTEAAA